MAAKKPSMDEANILGARLIREAKVRLNSFVWHEPLVVLLLLSSWSLSFAIFVALFLLFDCWTRQSIDYRLRHWLTVKPSRKLEKTKPQQIFIVVISPAACFKISFLKTIICTHLSRPCVCHVIWSVRKTPMFKSSKTSIHHQLIDWIFIVIAYFFSKS